MILSSAQVFAHACAWYHNNQWWIKSNIKATYMVNHVWSSGLTWLSLRELCCVICCLTLLLEYVQSWQQIDKTTCTSKINRSINSKSSQILFWINIYLFCKFQNFQKFFAHKECSFNLWSQFLLIWANLETFSVKCSINTKSKQSNNWILIITMKITIYGKNMSCGKTCMGKLYWL